MPNSGDLIKCLRKNKNLTILELAERMGVSPEYLAKAEQGQVSLKAEQVETIESFLRKDNE